MLMNLRSVLELLYLSLSIFFAEFKRLVINVQLMILVENKSYVFPIETRTRIIFFARFLVITNRICSLFNRSRGTLTPCESDVNSQR